MSDWQQTTIGDCFSLEPGFAFKSADFRISGTPVIKIKNVKAGSFSDHQFDYVDPSFIAQRPAKVARYGDLLISMSGNRHDGSPETWVGKIAPFMRHEAYLINQRVGALRVKNPSKINARFAGFLLSSWDYQQHFIAIATSSGGQANLSPNQILSTELLLPPIHEQRAIAEVLSSFEDKIELNRRMNETMEAMAQAIFRDWFVDFGPVRRKMAGATDSVAIMGGLTPDPTRAVELAALFPDALGDDDLPVGWKLEPVTAFAVIKGGKQLEKRHIHSSGPNPVFGGAGVMGYTTLSNAEGYVITVGRVGAYCGQFFGHRGAAWVNNNASLITPLEGVAPEWLLLALRNSDIDLIKRGAAQPFVSNGDVGNLSITAPGSQILEAFGKLVEPLFRMSEARDVEAKTLAETRDYLLPRLMSGEVRVGDAALEIAA